MAAVAKRDYEAKLIADAIARAEAEAASKKSKLKGLWTSKAKVVMETAGKKNLFLIAQQEVMEKLRREEEERTRQVILS